MALENVLQVPGSLSVIPLDIAADLTAAENNLVRTLTAEYAEAARESAFTGTAVSFYIMAEYDINAKVTNSSGDLLGLQGIALSSADATGVTLNLPSFSGKELNTGDITYNGTTGLTNEGVIGTFTSKVVLGMDNQGAVNASVQITGDALSVSVTDDTGKAQVVLDGVKDKNAAATASSADVLSATLTEAEVIEYFGPTGTNQIAAIEQLYTKNIISSWRIDVTPIAEDANSIIARYSRNHLSNNQGGAFNKPFGEGQMLVTDTAYGLQITLTDVDGQNVNMFAEEKQVFGVLKQKTPAAQ